MQASNGINLQRTPWENFEQRLEGASMQANNANALVKFNFQGDELDVIKDGDTLWVSVRRVCEALGLASNKQCEKLKFKAWARDTLMVSPDARGYNQTIFMIDLDSFPMWLATIDANRVADHVRPKLEAYQKEAAKALRNYFIDGYAFNDQMLTRRFGENALLIQRNKAALECIQILSTGTLFNPHYLKRYAEHIIAEIKGTEASNENRVIDVSTFLKGKGMPRKVIKKVDKSFGKYVKSLYVIKYGESPKKCHRFVNGSERLVNSYTEEDLPLFEEAYQSYLIPRLEESDDSLKQTA